MDDSRRLGEPEPLHDADDFRATDQRALHRLRDAIDESAAVWRAASRDRDGSPGPAPRWAATRDSDVQIMAETLIDTKGAAALGTARRRLYAARARRDDEACGVWLRVAEAIKTARPAAVEKPRRRE